MTRVLALLLCLIAASASAQKPAAGPPGAAVTSVATGASGQALAQQQSTAAEASHIFNNNGGGVGPGNLYTLGAVNTGAAGFVLLIDGTTLPANGTLPACGSTNAAGCLKGCYVLPIGSTTPAYFNIELSPGVPIPFVNGVVVAYSTTGCFALTIGTAAVFFEGRVY